MMKININRLRKIAATLALISIPLGFFGVLLAISYDNLGFDLFFSKAWSAVKIIAALSVILFLLLAAEKEVSKH